MQIIRLTFFILLILLISYSDGRALSIEIHQLATIEMGNNSQIKVCGNWLNYGQFRASEGTTVAFSGTTTDTIRTFRSAGETFYNLIINNDNNVHLNDNATIEGRVSLANGNLIIAADDTLKLIESAAISGEQAGRYIIGRLLKSENVGVEASIFGGIGLSLSTGIDNLGNVSVLRISGEAIQVLENAGINRSWQINSGNLPLNGRELTLSWVADDDNDKELTTLQAWQSDDQIVWNAHNVQQDVAGTRSVTINTNKFSNWTVSDGQNPLIFDLLGNDDKIDALDAQAICRYLGDNNLHYDLNRDGVFDERDVNIILKQWKENHSE